MCKNIFAKLIEWYFAESVSSFSTLSGHIDSTASLLKETSTEWIHVEHKDGLF